MKYKVIRLIIYPIKVIGTILLGIGTVVTHIGLMLGIAGAAIEDFFNIDFE